jgi:glycerol-3-phosphate acyltransferase PlsY
VQSLCQVSQRVECRFAAAYDIRAYCEFHGTFYYPVNFNGGIHIGITRHLCVTPGATNITRVFGKKAGLTVFVIDFAKGLVAVLIARILVRFLNAPYESVLFAGFFVQIGHIFPVFYKFRGGKGVSSAAGAAMGIMPLTAVTVLLIFIIIYSITKTVSISSLISAVCYPLVAYVMGGNNSDILFLFAASCSILIIVKHSQNIRRLLDGKEKPVK